MKNWQRAIVFSTLGIIFTLAPTIFPYGWLRLYPALFLIIGLWFFGEVASEFDITQLSLPINWQLRYLSHHLVSARILMGIGALLMLFGTFLPWFQTIQPLYGVTANAGFNTDGMFIGLASIIPLGVTMVKRGVTGKPYSIFSMLWGIYILFFLFGVNASLSTSVFIFRELGAKLGIGINVSFTGILLTIIGGVMNVNTKSD